MSKMIYSDAENLRWWEGLGKTGQAELFALILERSTSESYKRSVSAIQKEWEQGEQPTLTALISLRKWAA